MRNIKYILFIIGVLSSCTVSEMLFPQEGISYESEDASYEDSLLISSMGIDIKRIEDYDTYYVVNDVILFDKSELHLHPQTRLCANYSVTAQLQRISIGLAEFGAIENDREMLEYAISQWNSLTDSNIYFCMSDDTSIEHYDWITVTINSYGEYSNPMYQNMLLVEGQVGPQEPSRQVHLNKQHSSWKAASETQKKYAFMHMLGQVVGLYDGGYKASLHIFGTSQNDSNSIMRSHLYLADNPNTCWNGFSEYDTTDIPKAFPIVPDEITFDFSNQSFDNTDYFCRGEQTITVSSIFDIPGKIIEESSLSYSTSIMNVTENTMVKYVSDSNTFTLDLLDGCTYKLTTTVKNTSTGKDLLTKNKTISVVAPNFTASFPDSIELNQSYNLIIHSPYGKPRIDYSIVETLFGNSSAINILSVADNVIKFKVTGYGAFDIKIGPADSSTKFYKLSFTKYYRPTYVMSNTDWLEDLEYTAYSSIAERDGVLPNSNTIVGYRTNLNVQIGEDDILQDNFYGVVYVKYFYNGYHYIDISMLEHGLLRIESFDCIIKKGASSTYNFPALALYEYYQGSTRYEYIGYYAMVIPSDSIAFTEI